MLLPHICIPFLGVCIVGCTHHRGADVFANRAADWRNGAVVYQVIVDRFAPSLDLDAKRDLYPAPKVLRSWDEVPTRGTYLEDVGVWSHEVDFWGGDLESLRARLPYIQDLGVDVLYLNPIHMAYTNHKYDAQDYFKVSPEYGTRADVIDLAGDLHQRDMRLVMDGVFNHMGRTSPFFQDALNNPQSKYRDWYNIGPQYEKWGYRAWYDVQNLPELNLENRALRKRLWLDRDSAIQGYLRDGVDGWRLDVAFDIGYKYLDELTRSAHHAKSDSVVIGEIWNYPEKWFPSIDGIMNMTQREIILKMTRNETSAVHAARVMDTLVADTPYDHLLKSWVMLDNHDVQRLATSLPEEWQQRMAQVLQFTLPGSPCLYYGVEVGMEGGDDPRQRGPMRWDLANDENPQFVWTKKLIALRKENPALRVGDYRAIETEHLFAFLRHTDKIADTVLVVANPTDEEQTEFIVPRESGWMSQLVDQITGENVGNHFAGTYTITVPPQTIYVLKANIIDGSTRYTPYKRIP